MNPVKLIMDLIAAFDAGEKTADEVIAEMRTIGPTPDAGSDAAGDALAADMLDPGAADD